MTRSTNIHYATRHDTLFINNLLFSFCDLGRQSVLISVYMHFILIFCCFDISNCIAFIFDHHIFFFKSSIISESFLTSVRSNLHFFYISDHIFIFIYISDHIFTFFISAITFSSFLTSVIKSASFLTSMITPSSFFYISDHIFIFLDIMDHIFIFFYISDHIFIFFDISDHVFIFFGISDHFFIFF